MQAHKTDHDQWVETTNADMHARCAQLEQTGVKCEIAHWGNGKLLSWREWFTSMGMKADDGR